MRILRVLLATLVPLLLLAACGGDDEGVSTGDDSGVGAGSLPDRAPDLVGTITAVTPFEPITEDCVPPEDADPDGAVSSDDPPVCTPDDYDGLGTVLVEERPGVQEGRKISYGVSADTSISGTGVAGFADLEEGQTVDSWVAGDICAESYPEQCGAEALHVTG